MQQDDIIATTEQMLYQHMLQLMESRYKIRHTQETELLYPHCDFDLLNKHPALKFSSQ